MKTLLLLLLFSLNYAYADYKCTKAVDKLKTMIFIDTNHSSGEVNQASRAACERGETFLVLTNTEEEADGDEYYLRGKLNTVLKKMATENIAVTSIIGSGHNGGGNLHGDKGAIYKTEIISALKQAYKGKKNLLDQFQSIYMWGCWSMGPAEVSIWRDSFPSLKMAAGFIGSAPLAATAASPSILYDLLQKEKSLIETADQQKLKRSIGSVKNLLMTYGAVYTEASCGNMYYYLSELDLDADADPAQKMSQGSHFVNFDQTFDCKLIRPKADAYRKSLMEYLSGQEPIPEDGPKSQLREIYSFSRSYADCFNYSDLLNADRVGLLRFFGGVKENFAKTFKPYIRNFKKELKILDTVLLSENLTDPMMKSLAKYYKANRHKVFIPTAENLKTKNRKQINEMVSFMVGLKSQRAMVYTNFKNNFKGMSTLISAMDSHLYQVDPHCMDFLAWHEARPDETTNSYCW